MRGDIKGEGVYNEEVKTEVQQLKNGEGAVRGNGVSEYCGGYNCKREGKQSGTAR